MNNNNLPLAIALAAAFLGASPQAAAAALGEVWDEFLQLTLRLARRP